MKTINPNALSFVTMPVSLHFKETGAKLHTGTAFIYKFAKKFYLITNWHIVTGLSPIDKKPISEHGGIPDQMHVSFLLGHHPMSWGYYPLDLYIDNSADWFVHPIHKEKVDVIAIEIDFDKNFSGIIKPLNDTIFDDFTPEVGDDLFILGYPYSISGGGNFPIWKRGSVASEPEVNYDDLPKFFIDTASKSGMSGAPVIFKRVGIHGAYNGKLTSNTIFGEIRNFIGVYSGRLIGDSNFDAQLGIVWKKEVIEEIIKGNLKDTRNFA